MYGEQATGTRELTYLFESVTHNHFVHMSFEGQSVVYTTSQQGPLGQNGSTLRIFPQGLGSKGGGNRFLDTTFKLADRITEAASDPNPIGLLPRGDTEGNTIFKSINLVKGLSGTGEVKTSVSEGSVDQNSAADEPPEFVDPEVGQTAAHDFPVPVRKVSTGKSNIADEPSVVIGDALAESSSLSGDSMNSGEPSKQTSDSDDKGKDALSMLGL
jgi:hypothetical protein